LVGILGGESKCRRKNAGLVLASRVLRIQAVVNKLLPIDDSGLSRR
jgi:hypothetical protein